MTKRELEQIRNLNGVIKVYQTEFELLKYKSLIKGSIPTGMPFGTDVSDNTGNIATQMAEYEVLIEKTLNEMQKLRIEIMHYISTVDDNVLKQVLYYWNVCCMTWYEVANSVSKPEYVVKKMYYRHFKKEKR